MHLKAKFLASEKKTFTAEDGREVTYMRIYAWVPDVLKAKELRIATDQISQIEDADLKFGDEFECTVEEGVSAKTHEAFLKVMQW